MTGEAAGPLRKGIGSDIALQVRVAFDPDKGDLCTVCQPAPDHLDHPRQVLERRVRELKVLRDPPDRKFAITNDINTWGIITIIRYTISPLNSYAHSVEFTYVIRPIPQWGAMHLYNRSIYDECHPSPSLAGVGTGSAVSVEEEGARWGGEGNERIDEAGACGWSGARWR